MNEQKRSADKRGLGPFDHRQRTSLAGVQHQRRHRWPRRPPTEQRRRPVTRARRPQRPPRHAHCRSVACRTDGLPWESVGSRWGIAGTRVSMWRQAVARQSPFQYASSASASASQRAESRPILPESCVVQPAVYYYGPGFSPQASAAAPATGSTTTATFQFRSRYECVQTENTRRGEGGRNEGAAEPQRRVFRGMCALRFPHPALALP